MDNPNETSCTREDLCLEQVDIASQGATDRLPSAQFVLRDLLANLERTLLVVALVAAGGSQKRAAIALGVLPTTLQEKLKRFGLLDPRPRRRPPYRSRTVPPINLQALLHEAQVNPTKEPQ